MDSIKVENANKRNKCQQDGIKNNFFSGLVIFNNYRMFTFLVYNSDVDYRLVEKYFPNCCWTTPIGKLARATRDRINNNNILHLITRTYPQRDKRRSSTIQITNPLQQFIQMTLRINKSSAVF